MVVENFGRWSVWIAVATVGTAYAVGLHPGQKRRPLPPPRATAMNSGIDFRLTEGRAVQTTSAERLPESPAVHLPDDEALRILSRLQPAAVLPDDEVPFALRDSSLPPPRAGKTIDTPFPPPAPTGPAPETVSGALEVRRISPDGDVDLAERITVTFSQPMVALTSQDEAAAQVPVRLSPKVDGTWRWMGTQTLVFDPGSGKRLPMATEFTVTVPAGTQSVSGGVLPKDVVSTVRTPAPRILSAGPEGEGQPRDAIIWMLFDQKVDPAAILSKVSVRGPGSGSSLRLATDSERKSVLSRWGAGFPPERVVVLKPSALLPAAHSGGNHLGQGSKFAGGTTGHHHRTPFPIPYLCRADIAIRTLRVGRGALSPGQPVVV